MNRLDTIFTDSNVMPDITPYLEWTGKPLWNAIYTVQLGELIEHGVFDWTDDILDWSAAAYDDEQYNRVCAYFIEQYRYREISIEPYLEWALMLHKKLVYELMPKYAPLYKRVEDGINPLQISDEYFKRRAIGSDYPETLLSGNADYISNGQDEEHEKLTEGNLAESFANFASMYKPVDSMLIDELDCMFISLYTVSIDAF